MHSTEPARFHRIPHASRLALLLASVALLLGIVSWQAQQARASRDAREAPPPNPQGAPASSASLPNDPAPQTAFTFALGVSPAVNPV